MKTKIIIGAFLLMSINSFTQDKKTEKVINKGKFFFYWGWNRANYSNSDIHFTGGNFNILRGFRIHDCKNVMTYHVVHVFS